jgi:hypothetical protein
MRGRAVHKFYEGITGAERFRLVLAAEARGDAAELAHLVGTCPIFLGPVQDPAYTDHVQATFGLVHALLIGVEPLIGWLELLHTIDPEIEATLDALVAGTAVLLGTSPPQGVEPEPAAPSEAATRSQIPASKERLALPILTAARTYATMQIKAAMEGFARACREVAGLDPDAVIAAFALVLTEHLAPFQAAMDAAEPDPDAVEGCLEGFASVWEAWMNPGTHQEPDEG